MHPVAGTIKAVKIKPSFATTVQDIITFLLQSRNVSAHSMAIFRRFLTMLNIKIKVTIPTADPLCIAKSIVRITGKGCRCICFM
jgi:hypothetical protein